MQEREEKKKPETKSVGWPGTELETDVLSVLSSPSTGRSEVGGHSSVQQPHGQSFAVDGPTIGQGKGEKSGVFQQTLS